MKTSTLIETTRTLHASNEELLLTDERLMEMIQNHSYEALCLLGERYHSLLSQIAVAVLHNAADVEDLLQEVFIEIWNRAARYAPKMGRPLGWIVTLARRRAIDRLRKRDAYCRASDRFAEEIRGHSESWTHVHEDVARHEMKDYLSRALAGLPAAQRRAIQLAYHGQMSQREIAAHTGIPLGTVKTRLELGLRKMAVFLQGFEDLLGAGKRPGPLQEVTLKLRPGHWANPIAQR